MRFEPGRAYVRGLLWLPRERFDVGLLKHSLTFTPASSGPTKPQAIYAWADLPNHVGVPWMTLNQRQFNRVETSVLESIGCEVVDTRPRTWEEVDIRSRVVLDAIRPELTVQAQSVDAVNDPDIDCGILQLSCAYGKTIIALHAAARYRCPIVVVVDNKGLQQQWAEEVRRHLLDSNDNPVRVGFVGDGHSQWDAPVVIALVQSLFSKVGKIPMSVRRRFGVAVFDECLAENTRIAVPGGWREIGKLRVGDTVVTPSGTARVTAVRNSTRPAYRFSTRSGASLVASINHIVPTMGIRLETQGKIPPKKQWTGKITNLPISTAPHLLRVLDIRDPLPHDWETYLLGLYLGDGCCAKSTGYRMVFAFSGKHRVPITEIFRRISRTLDVPISESTNHRGDTLLALPAKFARSFLRRYGLQPGPKTYNACIPDDLVANCDAGVIRGLMDAEGARTRLYTQFVSTSRNLTEQVRIILARHGVFGRFRFRARTNPKHATLWTLTLTGTNARNYDRLFGFLFPKTGRISSWLRGRAPRRSQINIDPIIERTRVGVRKLVDISIDDVDNLFIAEGFLVHNCHLMGAPEFSKAAPLFMGRRIGLSATPRRLDGLERLYYLHLGQPVFTYLQQDMRPKFVIYRMRTRVNQHTPEFRANACLWGRVSVPKLFTYLSNMTERTYEIADVIRQGIMHGRKILVLSQRLYLLDQLEALFPEAGKIIGRTRGEDRKDLLREKDLLLCELKLGERGLNKPDLDMIVVCEPFRAVRRGELASTPMFQQIVGRVQRRHPGKATPVVVFIEDYVGPCLGLMKTVRKMIVNWPADQGGPFEFSVTGAGVDDDPGLRLEKIGGGEPCT